MGVEDRPAFAGVVKSHHGERLIYFSQGNLAVGAIMVMLPVNDFGVSESAGTLALQMQDRFTERTLPSIGLPSSNPDHVLNLARQSQLATHRQPTDALSHRSAHRPHHALKPRHPSRIRTRRSIASPRTQPQRNSCSDHPPTSVATPPRALACSSPSSASSSH